jgi:hypothetical protein
LQVWAGESRSGGDSDVGQRPVADRRRGEAIESTPADMRQQEHGVAAGDEHDLGLPQFSLDVLVSGVLQIQVADHQAFGPEEAGRGMDVRGRRERVGRRGDQHRPAWRGGH